MCEGCGCGRPSPPASSAGIGPIVPCPLASSAILVLDELGLPYGATPVRLTIAGVTSNATTGADGKLCLSSPPGTVVRVQIEPTHEARPGDSTTTPSGRHFAAGGSGP